MPLIDSDILDQPSSGNSGGGNFLPIQVGSPLVPQVYPSEDTQSSPDNNKGLSLDQIAQREISKVGTSPEGLSIQERSPAITQYERNENARYSHYIPGLDNEELAAINQSSLSKLGNSVVKGLATAAGTFIDNAMTFPNAIGAVKSGEVSSLFQSPLEKSVDKWLENLENKFPNYYSHWEQEHPLLSAIPFSGGAANFWGDKVIKNLGFTVGAIGGALAQDFVVGTVTGGLGDVVNLPSQVGRAALWLNKIFTTAEDVDKVLDAAKGASKILDFAKLRDAAKITEGTRNLLGKAQYTTSLLGAARTEAGFEARQGYDKLKGDLIQEYKDSHNGEDPDQATLDDIEKAATASANTRFAVNMGILALSDAIQFDSIFNMFNAERKGLSSVFKGINLGENFSLKATSLDAIERAPTTMKSRFFKKVLPGILSEGFFEEGLQNVTQEGTYDFYHNQYYDHNKDTWSDILSSTGKGFANTYGSTDGWEQVIIGALTSVITGPATRLVNRKSEGKQIDSALHILNENTLTGTFRDKYKDAANSLQISRDMKKAAANGNLFEYKNLKHDAFFNFINSALKIGRFDVRREQLNMLKEVGDEEFTQLFGLDPTDENRKNVTQYVDNLLTKAEGIKSNYESIKSLYPNTYKAYNNPKNDAQELSNIKYNLHNDWVESLSYYSSMAEDADERLQNIPQRWRERSEALSYLSPEVVSTPLSLSGLEELAEKYEDNKEVTKAIDTLKNNIENGEDPNLEAYKTILDKETGRSIGPNKVAQIAIEGGDINYINDRKKQALDAYSFLSSPEGQEYFARINAAQKEEKSLDNKEITTNVKYNSSANRTIKLESGKKYYIFSQHETPEKVPLRKGGAHNILKITDENITLTPDNSTKKATIPVSELQNFEVYTPEELEKTNKGKLFLNSLKTGQRWAMTVSSRREQKSSQVIQHIPISERSLRGVLDYIPSEDKLYFRYTDEGGKVRLLPVGLDQFEEDFKEGFGKFKVRPIGRLFDIQSAIKRSESIRRNERAQTAKFMRDALEDSITKHKSDLEKINDEIEGAKKQLESSRKTLSTLEEKNRNAGTLSPKAYKTLMSQLKGINTRISKVNNHISTLESNKDQLQYTIDYLSKVRDDLDENTVEPLTNFIAGTEGVIRDIDRKIEDLEGIHNSLLKVFNTISRIAKKFISKLKNSPIFRDFDIKELNDAIKSDKLSSPEDVIEKLEHLAPQIEAASEDTPIPQDQFDALKEALSLVNNKISDYQKQSNLNKALVQALYNKLDEIAAMKAKEEELKRDKLFLSRLFHEGRFTKSYQTSNPPTNPPSEDDGISEPKKKETNILFRSTTSDQFSPKPQLDKFYNTVDLLPNRADQRIILVTKNNEDSLNLGGLAQGEWDRATQQFPDKFKPEDITNENTGVILSLFVEEDPNSHDLYFINSAGKRIGKVGTDTPNQSDIIFTHMPTSSSEWISGGSRARQGEDITDELNSWREARKQILSNKEVGSIFQYDLSTGFPKTVEDTKNDVISTGLVSQKDLKDKQVVEVSTDNSISRGNRKYKVPSGRPVINYRSSFAFLNNRLLSQEEKNTIFTAIKELARKASEAKKAGKKTDILDRDITEYLRGIVYWGTNEEGKTTFRNQMGIGQGTLNLGENNTIIPFVEESIEENKPLIMSFLDRIYNTVANYKVKKTNSPYREGYIDKEGNLKWREWSNYQSYLVSPTYQLTSRDESGLHGKTRNNTPLSVSLDSISDQNPINFEGRYATLQKLYETKETPKPAPKVALKTAPKPTGNVATVVSKKAGKTFNIPYVLSAPISVEGKQDKYVTISFDKNDPETADLLKVQKDNGADEEKANNIILSNVVKDLVSRGILKSNDAIVNEGDNQVYFPVTEETPPEKNTKPQPEQSDSNIETDEELDELARQLAATVKPSNTQYRRAINPNNVPSIESKDWSVFEDYMRRNLPQFTSEQFNHLITMTGGGYAYGSMEDNLIKVFSGAPKGTEYHEAFEGVWAYFTSPEIRGNIYKELRSKKGEFFDILTGENVKFKDATESQLKEWAADRFGEYVYNNKPVRESSTLKRIFDSIINWFKNLFTRRSELTNLFKRIDSGYYKDSQIGPDSTIQNKPIPGLDATTVKDINDQITSSIINRIFSEKDSLFTLEKMTSNDLYSYAKGEVNNVIGKLYLTAHGDPSIPKTTKNKLLRRIKEKIDALNTNWDEIVLQHKEIMKVYGVEFNDNGGLTATDESRNFREYDKDYYKIDNLKSSSVAMKLLMATLAIREHGEKSNNEDVFGEPKVVPSSIGGVNLAPFAKSFVTVMDNLSGSDTLEEMMDKLKDLATDKPEFISLFKRLGGNLQSGKVDYNNLNYNQWRTLLKFYNTFSRQNPEARLQYNTPTGSYSQAASKNELIKRELSNWMEGIKAKSTEPRSIIYYKYDRKAKSGQYLVARERMPDTATSSDGSKEVNFLHQLGITHVKLDAVKAMESSDFDKFTKAVHVVYDKLKDNKGIGVPILTSRVLNLEGAFNNIARAYLSSIFREPTSVFLDENGEYRNNYVLHNRVSIFAGHFNKVKDVSRDLPVHLPHVANDVFSSHSVVLNASDGLFFADGSRVDNQEVLSAGYIMGSVDRESNRPKSLSAFTYAERLQTEINQNINGWYYFINSVDSNTEHMINLGNYIRWGDLGINNPDKSITNDIIKTFKGYILDEVGLISEVDTREKNSQVLREARGTERGADKLRFMHQILSTSSEGRTILNKIYKITDNSSPLEMSEAINTLLDEETQQLGTALKKYFKDRTDETKESLINNGQITPKDALFTWKGLDENAPVSFKEGISDEDINNLISWIEVNYAINAIEMHKLILGDPYQRKAKDEVKRVKLQLSPRNSTYHEGQYDTWASTNRNKTTNNTPLEKGEMGYVHYNTHANTVTTSDITAISTNSLTQTNNEAVNIAHELYHNVEETDSGAWGAPWFHKQFSEKQGDWGDDKETFYQEDTALARYEFSQEGKYTYTDPKLQEEDKDIAGRIKNQPFNDQYVTTVIKPSVTGAKDNADYIDTVSDKFSIFPLTYQLARRYPNLKGLYLRMFNSKREDGSPVDYVICKSGRKIGTDTSDNLYSTETGGIEESPFQSDIKVSYDTLGIITPVDYKEAGKVTQGTQITNLATIDLMAGGVPIDIKVERTVWDSMSESERVKESPLYAKISRYNNILNQRVDAGFKKLLNQWGVDNDTLKVTDKNVIAKVIQSEVFRRLLPDNIKDAIRVVDGEFVYPLEATNSYKEIMGIIMSQVDKSFISTKVNGQAAVQVPATLFERDHRKFAYKNSDGGWEVLESGKYNTLTPAQKRSLVAVSDTYKFYEPTIDEEGSIQSVARCEIGLSSKHIRSRLSTKLNKLLDRELIDYLNNTPEGQKILQGVAFRIPTSGLNLTEAFTIKEFLPDFYGDTVIVPSEITKKTGSDFDIDKLNIYLKNTYLDEDGELHLAKYFPSREESDQYYNDILEKILDVKFEKNLKESSKVADRLELLKSAGVVDNWDLFKRNEKYLNSFMEEVGDDDSLFDDKVKELDDKLNRLEDRGIELNDEVFRSQYKDTKLEELYLKGLENEMFESLGNLILDKNNYLRLITPNDAEKLIKVKKELNSALGIHQDIPAPLLNRRNQSTIRHNNLIGKTRVGTYSLSQIYNTIMQSEYSVFDPSSIHKMEVSDYIKQILYSGSKIKHNETTLSNGEKTIDFGRVKDIEGNYISDTINPLISGAVDMPSDQSLSEVGFVEQRAPVGMAMVRAGIPLSTTVWMLNQPIVREFINDLNSRGMTNLLNEKRIENILSRFSGGEEVNNINEKLLKNNIEDYYKNNKKFNNARNAEQRAIFREFLYYAAISQELFGYNQALNYDRANFSDTTLVADKELSTQRALQRGTITGIQQVLDKTFLGRIRNNLQDARDVMGSFLSLEGKGVREYIDTVSSEFSQPGMYISGKNKVSIGKSIKTSMIDYLVQTGGLNKEIEGLLVNNKTAIAKKFQEVKANNKKEYNTLAQNPVIQQLEILSQTPHKGVINLSFEKKDMDPNSSNILTEGFRELKKNVYIRDNNLYKDIVKLSILQSGTDNSPISFTQFIPVEDFAKVVKPAIDNIGDADLNAFVENGNFFRNNWWRNEVVPQVRTRKVYDPELRSQGIKRLVTVPYGNVPNELSQWAGESVKTNGKLIGLRSDYNSREAKFPFVKITIQDPSLTSQEVKLLKSKRDRSLYISEIYKQVLDSEGNPLFHTTDNGVKVYLYKQVNGWGNRYFAREHYNSPQQSVINNGTIKVPQEYSDGDIVGKYKELYSSIQVSSRDDNASSPPLEGTNPTSPPNFDQDNTEGTDQTCPF